MGARVYAPKENYKKEPTPDPSLKEGGEDYTNASSASRLATAVA